jgi:hypothetical protein
VVEIAGFQIGAVELTRVPYFDVASVDRRRPVRRLRLVSAHRHRSNRPPRSGARGDERSALHLDGDRAAEVIDALVADAQADESLLVGPLWPFPGAGYVAADGAVVAAD